MSGWEEEGIEAFFQTVTLSNFLRNKKILQVILLKKNILDVNDIPCLFVGQPS